MNFNTTDIAIRERGFAEIMDLALRVAGAHAGPLLLAGIVGSLPWMLLNSLFLYNFLAGDAFESPEAYGFWLPMLMALEAPLATAPITLYLGQVTFTGKGSARKSAGDFLRSLPQMLVSQGIVRVLCACLFVVGLLLPYASWPYLSELILLERNPMFGGKGKDGAPAAITTRKRSKNLHRGAGGDLLARWMVATGVGGLLVAVLTGGVYTLLDQLFGLQLSWQQTLLWIVPPIGWLVVGFFAVVRFLAYLDLRIRREGWEVELRLRTEGARLARMA